MPPKRRLVLENRRLQEAAFASGADAEPFIGNTPAMLRIKQTLRHIADADVDVLVEGETGTGKVVASALHRLSRRRQHELVAINCGALPESVIESELFGHEAGAFTGAQKSASAASSMPAAALFLDEIESMPLNIRSSSCACWKPARSRRWAPTTCADWTCGWSRPPKTWAARWHFREDLFYRLNVVTIRIPPLRERRDDIPLLFAHYLGIASRRFQRDIPDLPAQVRQHLLEHAWPGNVRELAHFAERVVLGVHGGTPLSAPQPAGAGSLPERVERFEAQIRDALAVNHGDIKSTLEALGIPRKTFYDKLQRHGMTARNTPAARWNSGAAGGRLSPRRPAPRACPAPPRHLGSVRNRPRRRPAWPLPARAAKPSRMGRAGSRARR